MQQTHLRLARTRQRYPWELTDETRRIGKQGLAVARAILDAKNDGPAQLSLELRFDRPASVASLRSAPLPAPPRPGNSTASEPTTLAA